MVENGFELLEERVRKAADLVKKLRKENKELEDELGPVKAKLVQAEKHLAELEKQKGAQAAEVQKLEALSLELKGLHKEREEVRRRIAKLVEVLDGLE
jgi:septal ring factor EnvC (AmiA/AmiB activator)